MFELELLEERVCPSVPTYHGGPVIQNPQVFTLFVGNYSQSFDQAISVATGDYTKILGVFGVQSASRDGVAVIPYPGQLTNASLSNLLVQQIQAGVVPQPSPNQVDMIIVQQASMPDVPNAGAYHTWTYDNGVAVPFTVSFSVGPNAGTYGIFHEYAEVTTDPFVTGWFGTNYNEEIADLAGGATFSLDGFTTAAQVVGPDGNFISSPTTFVPTGNPVNSVNSNPNNFNNLNGINGTLIQVWEQYITAIIQFWHEIENFYFTALATYESELVAFGLSQTTQAIQQTASNQVSNG